MGVFLPPLPHFKRWTKTRLSSNCFVQFLTSSQLHANDKKPLLLLGIPGPPCRWVQQAHSGRLAGSIRPFLPISLGMFLLRLYLVLRAQKEMSVQQNLKPRASAESRRSPCQHAASGGGGFTSGGPGPPCTLGRPREVFPSGRAWAFEWTVTMLDPEPGTGWLRFLGHQRPSLNRLVGHLGPALQGSRADILRRLLTGGSASPPQLEQKPLGGGEAAYFTSRALLLSLTDRELSSGPELQVPRGLAFTPGSKNTAPISQGQTPAAAGPALVLPEDKLKHPSHLPEPQGNGWLLEPSRASLCPSLRPVFGAAGCRNYSFLVSTGPILHGNTTCS